VAKASAATPSRTGEGAIVARPPRYDLTPGWPDVAAFPRSPWLSAVRRALAAAPANALGYIDPRGRPELRTAVAEYLARARGVRADPDRIVICAGFTQGWGLVCGVLHDRGARTVAMEAHGVGDHRRIATRHRLRIRDLAVDSGGAVIEPDDASVILLTAAHQFPLGMALVPARRAQAVAWAKQRGGLVVEDDYDGEFRYDRHPVGAMQALAPEHVVYAGTTSKSLAPGLRLGWLVLPSKLVAPITDAQALALGGVSAIDQLTLAQLIASGSYDRHVRRARLTQRRRRDRLLAMVAHHSPHVRVTGIAAGLHALVTLPDGVSESAVIDAAARRGLALDGLARFTTGEPPEPGALVIGYGTPPEHSYTAALARLDATLTEMLSPSQNRA
jgi:GntR family transcriptional regulator/MocR family aminotransferase